MASLRFAPGDKSRPPNLLTARRSAARIRPIGCEYPILRSPPGIICWCSMLSQTGKYAIRAMVILAGRESTAPFDAAQISSQLSLPANYLAKILQVLARAGLLNSTRGIHGGYSLARPPDQITLLSIVEPFENALKRQACLMGRAECGRDVSCLMHSRWH